MYPSPEEHKSSFEKAKNASRPKEQYFKDSLKAFFVGGLICLIAELITHGFMALGLSKNEAGSLTTIILVFFGAFFTGIGVYDKIGRFAGAGSIVPITGFANSIVASAMEFKAEGPVFGIGAKMFNIAGPVIVYGVVSSWIVGLIYYLYLIIAR
jgi:stage V sporulation protein AC